jgi:hypothetical protein
MKDFSDYLRALQEAILGNSLLVLQITGEKDLLHAVLKLVDYRVNREDAILDSHEIPRDYTVGAEVRAKAVELLGTIGDLDHLGVLEEKLHDLGDDNGYSMGRCTFYFTNRNLVRSAAEKAICELNRRCSNS